MGKTFFLVHGAWCGGWCWGKLKPLLEAEGHTVIAPDMPGHGENRLSIEEQTLETYADMVEALIKPLHEPVILVGHSFGGMITSQVACRIPDRIKNIVYIAAFLPENGQSCVEITKSARPTFHEKLVEAGYDFILSADGKSSRVPPEAGADFIFNDVPRSAALEMANRLGPESNAAQGQAITLNSAFHDIPKSYVRCVLDRTVEIRLQDQMIAATHCEEVYTLETGHCPFVSAPRKLSNILLNLRI